MKENFAAARWLPELEVENPLKGDIVCCRLTVLF
jgi:hypothetical protein